MRNDTALVGDSPMTRLSGSFENYSVNWRSADDLREI